MREPANAGQFALSARFHSVVTTAQSLEFRPRPFILGTWAKSEPSTHCAKRDSIASAIEKYEKRLDQARADLAHVNGIITLFEVNDDADLVRPYTDIHRLYKRGKRIALCKEALDARPYDYAGVCGLHHEAQGP